MLWKTFGQCWAECGIPLHLPILGDVEYAYRPPLPSCSMQSPCISHFYQLKAAVRPKVASLYAVHFFFSFFFFSFSTSRLVSANISLAAAQSFWHHFYLAHYMCLPAPYLTIYTCTHSCTHTRTHTRTMGLWFWGSYDTIQILLAAYSGKCVLCKAISLRSPDFPCQAALIHMARGGFVSTVLCFSWRARWTPIASLTLSLMG